MRMMVLVTFPTAKFNELWREGQVGPKIQQILEDTQPEAAYFGKSIGGRRGAVIIVDVADEADIARITEPWFLTFDADVETSVCMLPEDVAKIDMDALNAKYGG
ncbi:panthothenate synthetase [bacterium]|nr:panthothenate synthetase [bacterium]